MSLRTDLVRSLLAVWIIAEGTIGGALATVVLVPWLRKEPLRRVVKRVLLVHTGWIVFIAFAFGLLLGAYNTFCGMWVLVGSSHALSCRLATGRIPNLACPCHCSPCGYDLTGNLSGVCPECGSPFEIAELSAPLHGPRVNFILVLFMVFLAPFSTSIFAMLLAIVTCLYLETAITFFVLGVLWFVLFAAITGQAQSLVRRGFQNRQRPGWFYDELDRKHPVLFLIFHLVPIVFFWGAVVWAFVSHPPALFRWP